MTPLRVLEVAARRGNFTKASEELGMSQPSVSRHIASLEQALGAAVFSRDHNKVRLTEEGRALAKAVDLGLSHILAEVEKIGAPSAPSGLTLACTHSFAHGWLLPRFSKLRQATQGTSIKLTVSYWLQDVVIDEVDLIIGQPGEGLTGWPRLQLFDEIVYPVCAPAYLENNPDIVTKAVLLQAQLLDYDVPEGDQLGWEDWFANQGLAYERPADDDRFTNYHFMIQAAMDGEGVALGWHHLVADQVAKGRLIKIGPAHFSPAPPYTLEYRQDRVARDTITPILEWFQSQTSGFRRPE